MTDWDKLLNRLTRRLDVDPELRMDVSAELRTHLEDSAAEFRAAGDDENQSNANSTKALGDEDELSEQLWQANRRRMRLRGFFKWAARIMLVPAAIVVVAIIALGLKGNLYAPQLFNQDYNHLLGVKAIDENERFLLHGPPQAKTRLEQARAIHERWPDNPIYFANYICAYLNDPAISEQLNECDEKTIEEVIAQLDRGEKIEPDNAFYNILKAGILFDASSEEKLYSVNREDAPERGPYVQVSDPSTFARALDEFNRSLDKPYFNNHALAMCRIRHAPAKRATRLFDRVYIEACLSAEGTCALLAHIHERRYLAMTICAYSLELAEQGRSDEAIRLAQGADMMAIKMGKDSGTLIEMLVVTAIRSLALSNEADVYKELGLTDKYENTEKYRDDWKKYYKALIDEGRVRSQEIQPHAAFLSTLGTAFSQYANLEPMRSAERAHGLQAWLCLLLTGVTLLGLLACAITGVSLLLTRSRKDGPKSVFVGWPRIGRICLLSIVIPILGYAAYLYASPFSGREYSDFYSLERRVLELSALSAVILCSLIGLSYSAIRARSDELGLSIPQRIGLRNRRVLLVIGLLLIGCILAYIVCWQAGLFRPTLPQQHSLFQ